MPAFSSAATVVISPRSWRAFFSTLVGVLLATLTACQSGAANGASCAPGGAPCPDGGECLALDDGTYACVRAGQTAGGTAGSSSSAATSGASGTGATSTTSASGSGGSTTSGSSAGTTTGTAGSSGGGTGALVPGCQATGYQLAFSDDFSMLSLSPNREGTYTWYDGIWWESPAPYSNISALPNLLSRVWQDGQTGAADDTSIETASQDGTEYTAWQYGCFEASMKWDVTTGSGCACGSSSKRWSAADAEREASGPTAHGIPPRLLVGRRLAVPAASG